MRVRLIIQDEEYRKAMIDVISHADKDVFLEIGTTGHLGKIDENTLILTDVPPEKCCFDGLSNQFKRIVFLTTDANDALDLDKKDEYQKLFKYKSISSIISDVEQINYLLTGESNSSYGLGGRVYAVCSDDVNGKYAQALARQVMFRRGGNILLVSLKYVNEYGTQDEANRSKFSRLMYYMDVGKEYPLDAFTYKDSYGITYLRLPIGLNPLAYINTDELGAVVRNLSHKNFDTVILDIGDSYSEVNIRQINKADNIVHFVSDKGKFNIDEILVEDAVADKVKEIQLGNPNEDIELTIDDYVRRIYEIEEPEENEQKRSNK